MLYHIWLAQQCLHLVYNYIPVKLMGRLRARLHSPCQTFDKYIKKWFILFPNLTQSKFFNKKIRQADCFCSLKLFELVKIISVVRI